MGLQTSLDILSRIVERYESNHRSIRHVEATSRADKTSLCVTMDLPVDLCASGGGRPELVPETAMLTDEGTLEVAFSPVLTPLPSAAAGVVSASNRAVRVTDDGDLLLTVELTIDPTHGETHATTGDDPPSTGPSTARADGASSSPDRSVAASYTDGSHSGAADDLAAVRDDSLPLYKDTEFLQRLYDSCDTFTEMNQKIEMDIASETVRRYTIEAGIHTPTTYDVTDEDDQHSSEIDEDDERSSGTDGDDPESAPSSLASDDSRETTPSEQLVTDGVGLPNGLRIEDVIDAVVGSATVYEVQQHLDLERQPTQQLLEQLNLLDLVMHRMADDPERTVSYERVVSRIRQCAPGGA